MPFTSVGFDTIEAVKVLDRKSIRIFLSHCQRVETDREKFIYRDNATRTMRCTLEGNALRISVSIPHYLHGHNIQLSDYKDISKFIGLFESRFGISFEDAQVTRMDITATIETECPFADYLAVFTNPRYYGVPVVFDTSLYMNSKNVVVHCYDKSIQDRKNLKYVQKQCDERLNPNLSRIEVRLQKKVRQTLRKKGEWIYQQVLLGDLSKKEHYLFILRYAEQVMNATIVTPKRGIIRSKKGFSELYLLKHMISDPTLADEIEEMYNTQQMTKEVYEALRSEMKNAAFERKRVEIQSLLKTAFNRTVQIKNKTKKSTETTNSPIANGILVKIPPKLNSLTHSSPIV